MQNHDRSTWLSVVCRPKRRSPGRPPRRCRDLLFPPKFPHFLVVQDPDLAKSEVSLVKPSQFDPNLIQFDASLAAFPHFPRGKNDPKSMDFCRRSTSFAPRAARFRMASAMPRSSVDFSSRGRNGDLGSDFWRVQRVNRSPDFRCFSIQAQCFHLRCWMMLVCLVFG